VFGQGGARTLAVAAACGEFGLAKEDMTAVMGEVDEVDLRVRAGRGSSPPLCGRLPADAGYAEVGDACARKRFPDMTGMEGKGLGDELLDGGDLPCCQARTADLKVVLQTRQRRVCSALARQSAHTATTHAQLLIPLS